MVKMSEVIDVQASEAAGIAAGKGIKDVEKYRKLFAGRFIVVKIGGSALSDLFTDMKATSGVVENLVLTQMLGLKLMLVHGGANEIDKRCKELNIATRKIRGKRYTDEKVINVVDEVLGRVNEKLVALINQVSKRDIRKIKAVGMHKKIIFAQKYPRHDLGFVGEVTDINRTQLMFLADNVIPVITPVGLGETQGTLYNINADHVATALAQKIGAAKLVVITNVKGIYGKFGDEDTFMSTVKFSQAKKMIDDGKIVDGMIPKVNACMSAIKGGVEKAHIIDGRLKDSLIREIFTDEGVGTEIIED